MKFPHTFNWFSVHTMTKQLSFSFLSLSLISFGIFCLDTPNAHGVPPDWSYRTRTYPQAFITFMDVHFGRAWMHTVQERVVLQMYASWCDKNFAMKKEKEDR